MRRLSPLPLTLFVAASLLLLGLLAALDGSPTTWANSLDDTPTPTATTAATGTPTATDTPATTATETVTATATMTATVATTPTPTFMATATATSTPAFIRYFPLLRQASGMRLGWRCWPDDPRVVCGPSPTPTMTATPTPTTLTPTPTATGTPTPTETATPVGYLTPTATLIPPSPTPLIPTRLNAVTLVSATDGWAVGDHGGILHWDGRQWARVASPTTSTLNAVSHVAANDVWTAGDDGAIVHWDGHQLRNVPSGTTSPITAIYMLSATDGWAAGMGGFILRWDGQRWYWFASTGGDDPLSIDMLSATEGWLVGKNGLAMRWNGTQWTKVAVPPYNMWTPQYPTVPALRSVAIISPADAWAVGYNPSQNGATTYEWHAALYHWDGSAWRPVASPTRAPLYAIHMRAANDGWAVGQRGHIIHWDGQRWSTYGDLAPYPMPLDIDPSGPWATNEPLYGVAATSASDAWAVGDQSSLIHWNGQSWTATTMLPLTPTPTITLTPSVTLTPTVTPTSVPGSARLNGIVMISPAEGWAVGDGGLIMRWRDTLWRYVPSPTTENLTAVAAVSPNDAWAVGDQGAILRWDGEAWKQATRVDTTLRTIVMTSANEGWAAGGVRTSYGSEAGASVLHWDGEAWTRMPALPDRGYVQSVYGLSNTPDQTLWAVGPGYEYHYCKGMFGGHPCPEYGSGVFHRDGDEWSPVYRVQNVRLRGIAMTATNDGWAIGEALSGWGAETGAGVLMRWDGQTWSDFPKPTLANLNAITMLSPTDGWIVGDGGVILHWDGASWNAVDSPTWANLLAITPVGPYDGWIVGRDQWNEGVLLKYSLQASPAFTTPTATRTSTPSPTATITPTVTPSPTPTFTLVPTPTATPRPVVEATLKAVTLISPSDGWAVGEGGVILRWDGIRWAQVSSPTQHTLHGVAHSSSTDVWAVGDEGTVIHWDGATWASYSTGITNPLRAVTMTSATDGWAAGDRILLRWDGSAWQRFRQPPWSNLSGNGIAAVSPTAAYLVSGWLMRWDGTMWQWEAAAPGFMWGVAAVSEQEAWAVGDFCIDYFDPNSSCWGYIWHRDVLHPEWMRDPQDQGPRLYAIAMANATSGWAVGKDGGILKWDGSAWRRQASRTTMSLYGVAMLSAMDGWAVGEQGIMLHWDGQSWTQTSTLPTPTPTAAP